MLHNKLKELVQKIYNIMPKVIKFSLSFENILIKVGDKENRRRNLLLCLLHSEFKTDCFLLIKMTKYHKRCLIKVDTVNVTHKS